MNYGFSSPGYEGCAINLLKPITEENRTKIKIFTITF
jgi:hypothetical protein